MKLTMPQIIMLNHAAETNRKRLDKRLNSNKSSASPAGPTPERVETWNGKPIDQLTGAEYLQYHRSAV
jgi:hypothetical protein